MKKNKINIGINHQPFIIAEMSANHSNSLKNALKLIDKAAYSGASAVKIQTFTADEMTINSSKKSFYINDKKNLWKGQKLYKLYEKASTPRSWHKALFERAKKKNIILFSTPFSENAVDFLETFNPPLYKIASFENNDLKLIEKVAKTKKPIIISTGMASVSQIKLIIKTIRKFSNNIIILLKCTSSYPAPFQDLNLKTIEQMRKIFKCEIGLSDHSIGITAPILSIAYGATVIEKHFKIDEKGLDAKFSLNPDEFKKCVVECANAKKAIGKNYLGVASSEKNNLKYRRSLFLIKDLKKGKKFTKENISSIRGGKGLDPKFLSNFIGKISLKNLKGPRPLSFKMIKK